jgi:GntR family transcriptional regulator
VLAVTHDVSDQAEADDLRIPIGTAVIRVRRLRTAQSLPFCIETGIVPAAMTPGLTPQMLSKDRSIDDILIGHYGIHITERSSEISATPIGAVDAKLLGMTVGTNALVYRTLARTQDGVALARIISLNHPDRVVFTTETPA